MGLCHRLRSHRFPSKYCFFFYFFTWVNNGSRLGLSLSVEPDDILYTTIFTTVAVFASGSNLKKLCQPKTFDFGLVFIYWIVFKSAHRIVYTLTDGASIVTIYSYIGKYSSHRWWRFPFVDKNCCHISVFITETPICYLESELYSSYIYFWSLIACNDNEPVAHNIDLQMRSIDRVFFFLVSFGSLSIQIMFSIRVFSER